MTQWIRRQKEGAPEGEYEYLTLDQIPLASVEEFQSSTIPGKGWALSDPPPAPPEPVLTVGEQRRLEYEKRGLTTYAMVVALWEKLMEPSAEHDQVAQDMQAERESVKSAIPK